MPTLTVLCVAILPVFILLWVVYRKDKFQKEPAGLLLRTFLLGIFSVLPAALLEWLAMHFTPSMPVAGSFYNGFCVAGLCEEGCKLLLLYWLIWRNPYFDEYFDGIVYAVFLSMGFACAENLTYVFGAGDYFASLATGFMRALLSVPAHFLFAVVMGYHFALAKFDPVKRRSHLLKAFLFPMLMHGTFDTILMVASEGVDASVGFLLLLLFVWFDIRMWKWGVRRIGRLQEYSSQQQFDRSNPFAGFQWISLLFVIVPFI